MKNSASSAATPVLLNQTEQLPSKFAKKNIKQTLPLELFPVLDSPVEGCYKETGVSLTEPS